MEPAPQAPPPPPTPSWAPIERGIRFAVFMTGGLVVLAFGVETFTAYLGNFLNCVLQTNECNGGFSTSLYYELLPPLIGGAFLIAVGAVLIVMATRVR